MSGNVDRTNVRWAKSGPKAKVRCRGEHNSPSCGSRNLLAVTERAPQPFQFKRYAK